MEGKLLTIINKIRAKNDLEKLKTLEKEDEDLLLREDLGFDSMDLAELTVSIEDMYEVDIFGDGLVETLGEVMEKVNEEGNL